MIRILFLCWLLLGIPVLSGAQATGKSSAKPARVATKLIRPVFPGGRDSLMRYIATHLRYPEAEHRAGTEGRVILRFLITKQGDPNEIAVIRSSGSKGLDLEAVRVIGSMPRWKPGRYGNKPVAMLYVLPVTFMLE